MAPTSGKICNFKMRQLQQVTESISGSVVPLAMFLFSHQDGFHLWLGLEVNLFKRPFSATFKAVLIADMPEVVCCKVNFGKQGF